MIKQIFFRLIVRPVLILVVGVNVRRRHLLPERGPAIVVANHNSHLDTAVLMTLLPARLLNRVRPVAAADYFLSNPLLAWFSRTAIGIIPIRRKGDDGDPLEALRSALDDEQILILFPEGTRGEPEEMADFKSGIGRLAMQCPNVPVIPVYLHGLGKILPKGAFLPVPFFSDVFVGEALVGGDPRFDADPHRFVEFLQDRVTALAGEAPKRAWD